MFFSLLERIQAGKKLGLCLIFGSKFGFLGPFYDGKKYPYYW
jgi:hypothetical protein